MADREYYRKYYKWDMQGQYPAFEKQQRRQDRQRKRLSDGTFAPKNRPAEAVKRGERRAENDIERLCAVERIA